MSWSLLRKLDMSKDDLEEEVVVVIQNQEGTSLGRRRQWLASIVGKQKTTTILLNSRFYRLPLV